VREASRGVTRLRALQDDLRALIAAPEGIRAALCERDEDAGAAPGTSERALERSVRSDERLSAAMRLDVYANAYFYRIKGVLEKDYPRLAIVLSEARFHDLVTSYLLVHPSQHFSLRFVGAHLADFIRDDCADSIRAEAPWAEDLARFEWALVDAFDAPDRPHWQRAALAEIPPEQWNELRLDLDPAAQQLELAWPVHRIADAYREDRLAEEPLALAQEPTVLLVWRRDERVFYRAPGRLEADALKRVGAGLRFGTLCETLADELGEEEAPTRAAQWLMEWTEQQLLLRS
jgi:hypothetical protein